jgi:hypothetical protein
MKIRKWLEFRNLMCSVNSIEPQFTRPKTRKQLQAKIRPVQRFFWLFKVRYLSVLDFSLKMKSSESGYETFGLDFEEPEGKQFTPIHVDVLILMGLGFIFLAFALTTSVFQLPL